MLVCASEFISYHSSHSLSTPTAAGERDSESEKFGAGLLPVGLRHGVWALGLLGMEICRKALFPPHCFSY